MAIVNRAKDIFPAALVFEDCRSLHSRSFQCHLDLYNFYSLHHLPTLAGSFALLTSHLIQLCERRIMDAARIGGEPMQKEKNYKLCTKDPANICKPNRDRCIWSETVLASIGIHIQHLQPMVAMSSREASSCTNIDAMGCLKFSLIDGTIMFRL